MWPIIVVSLTDCSYQVVCWMLLTMQRCGCDCVTGLYQVVTGYSHLTEIYDCHFIISDWLSLDRAECNSRNYSRWSVGRLGKLLPPPRSSCFAARHKIPVRRFIWTSVVVWFVHFKTMETRDVADVCPSYNVISEWKCTEFCRQTSLTHLVLLATIRCTIGRHEKRWRRAGTNSTHIIICLRTSLTRIFAVVNVR
jgi:hypothetical protein